MIIKWINKRNIITTNKTYLSKEQINKLKLDLMGKNNKRRRRKNKGHPYNDTFNSTSSEFYKMNNKILGINFENNIRETLKFEYQWKNLNLNESFLYSDIKIGDKTEVITDVNENKITLMIKK